MWEDQFEFGQPAYTSLEEERDPMDHRTLRNSVFTSPDYQPPPGCWFNFFSKCLHPPHKQGSHLRLPAPFAATAPIPKVKSYKSPAAPPGAGCTRTTTKEKETLSSSEPPRVCLPRKCDELKLRKAGRQGFFCSCASSKDRQTDRK